MSILIGYMTTGKIYYGLINLRCLEDDILVLRLHARKMRSIRICVLLNVGLEVKDG
jgi:hypothetical protein